jgi:hypothetical protein
VIGLLAYPTLVGCLPIQYLYVLDSDFYYVPKEFPFLNSEKDGITVAATAADFPPASAEHGSGFGGQVTALPLINQPDVLYFKRM